MPARYAGLRGRTNRMSDDREIWEAAYRNQGRIWAGNARAPSLFLGSRVLELGCGNGQAFSGLVSAGYDVLALDFSREAVRIAIVAGGRCAAGRGILADARRIPLASASIDAVVAWHIIGHMLESDRRIIAKEIARILRPEGTVFFREFSREDFRFFDRPGSPEPGTVLRKNGIRTHYFTEQEVGNLFSCLRCTSLATEKWSLRVRGKDYSRAEISAIFNR